MNPADLALVHVLFPNREDLALIAPFWEIGRRWLLGLSSFDRCAPSRPELTAASISAHQIPGRHLADAVAEQHRQIIISRRFRIGVTPEQSPESDFHPVADPPTVGLQHSRKMLRQGSAQSGHRVSIIA